MNRKWNVRNRLCPISNFRRQFRLILKHAGIETGQFHDLRCTCLTNWFANGLSEFDVMTMAGHSSFETTRRFYMAVQRDLIDRARRASEEIMSQMSVANLLQQPFSEVESSRRGEPRLSHHRAYGSVPRRFTLTVGICPSSQ